MIPLPAGKLGNLQVAPSGACSSWSCRQSLCWWWWWWWKPVFYSCLSLARQLGSGLRWPTPEWPRGKGKRFLWILRCVTCRVQHKFWCCLITVVLCCVSCSHWWLQGLSAVQMSVVLDSTLLLVMTSRGQREYTTWTRDGTAPICLFEYTLCWLKTYVYFLWVLWILVSACGRFVLFCAAHTALTSLLLMIWMIEHIQLTEAFHVEQCFFPKIQDGNPKCNPIGMTWI